MRDLAMEVLPVPGGPQKMMEGRRLDSTAERRREEGERRWSWPTTSSRVRGRIRSDRGWCWRWRWVEGGGESLGRLLESPTGVRVLELGRRKRSSLGCDVAVVVWWGGRWERIQSVAFWMESPPVAVKASAAKSLEKPMLTSCSIFYTSTVPKHQSCVEHLSTFRTFFFFFEHKYF